MFYASQSGLESTLSAQTAFSTARRRARWQNVWSWFKGVSNKPLSFESVRKRLKASEEGTLTLQDIALDNVIGSVGRARDYTATFLPQRRSDERRWVSIRQRINGLGGLPPIKDFKLAGQYFISDGHHRVSVMKHLGISRAEAWVTEMSGSALGTAANQG